MTLVTLYFIRNPNQTDRLFAFMEMKTKWIFPIKQFILLILIITGIQFNLIANWVENCEMQWKLFAKSLFKSRKLLKLTWTNIYLIQSEFSIYRVVDNDDDDWFIGSKYLCILPFWSKLICCTVCTCTNYTAICILYECKLTLLA